MDVDGRIVPNVIINDIDDAITRNYLLQIFRGPGGWYLAACLCSTSVDHDYL